MSERVCCSCGRPITTGKKAHRRCTACLVAAAMRTFSYTPDPYAVVEYREDESTWATRPERQEVRA